MSEHKKKPNPNNSSYIQALLDSVKFPELPSKVMELTKELYEIAMSHSKWVQSTDAIINSRDYANVKYGRIPLFRDEDNTINLAKVPPSKLNVLLALMQCITTTPFVKCSNSQLSDIVKLSLPVVKSSTQWLRKYGYVAYLQKPKGSQAGIYMINPSVINACTAKRVPQYQKQFQELAGETAMINFWKFNSDIKFKIEPNNKIQTLGIIFNELTEKTEEPCPSQSNEHGSQQETKDNITSTTENVNLP